MPKSTPRVTIIKLKLNKIAINSPPPLVLFVLTCCVTFHTTGGSSGSCDAITNVTEYFWNNDENRLTSSQYTVNWQSAVSDGNTVDSSPSK